MSDDNQLVNGLVEKIHQFLSQQIESNGGLSDAAKESLTVASECIEQAFKIQRKPASSELLDIYRSQKQQPSTNQQQSTASGAANNPAQFIANLASSILSQATAGASTGDTSASSSQQQFSTESTRANANSAPKIRKNATEAEKMAAESFKNQGNDFIKQDKHKEAYDCYTQAIEIDNNNAIYYSNRAAASMKLNDNHAALRDCQEAIEIDPNYSKAYGRMGLVYGSLGDHHKAKKAYLKAIELDPNNESYRNNLNIAEEALSSSSTANAAPQGTAVNMLRSMMSNPEFLRMAMQGLQDPRWQGLLNPGGQTGQANNQPTATNETQGENATSQQSTSQTSQNPPTTESNQQPNVNPADLLNMFSRFAGAANIDLVGAGQQILSSMDNNPEQLVNNIRRMMNMPSTPQNPNESDRNPPPGYS